MDVTVVLGKQGRVVIPSEVRVALGWTAGDRFRLSVSETRITMERQGSAAEALRGFARDVPADRSFVEELLAERRAAAAAE